MKKTIKTAVLCALVLTLVLGAVTLAIGCDNRQEYRNAWSVSFFSESDFTSDSVTVRANIYIDYSAPVIVGGGSGQSAAEYFRENIRNRFPGTGIDSEITALNEWEPVYKVYLNQDGTYDHPTLRYALRANQQIGYSKRVWDAVYEPVVLNFAPPSAPQWAWVSVDGRIERLQTRTYNVPVSATSSETRSARFARMGNDWVEVAMRDDLTYFYVTVARITYNRLQVRSDNNGLSISFSHSRSNHSLNFDTRGILASAERIYDRRGNLVSVERMSMVETGLFPVLFGYRIDFFEA